ncbi:M28 family peptidase [Emticicia sp. 21SJ11W-3]|uniref:M28 family peptidase n=1 Tax=Emticicia sp. 21SJ11W-3 TaxID=2916755 RepID=UPI00209F62FC|nr:M28 family peptidase [Emticicia sp. 21SJ11W-3]UTA67918.1 M20/M25/M40 family metallo-hydrolase [Emticicia sp. 21SJ11W-3]
MKHLLNLFFTLLPFISIAQKPLNNDARMAIEQIDSNRIKAHVMYLADDKLKGRQPGKEGFRMAVDYVQKQYKEMGLLPAGENGTYLQKVTLRKSRLIKEQTALTITLANGAKKPLTLGNEFFVYPHPEQKSIDFDAPLAIVGTGFDAPAIGIQDYKNLDVKGKIVIVLRKVPDHLSANVKLHLQYPATLQEYAAKNGAIGVLVCNYTNNNVQFKALANSMSVNGIGAAILPDGKRASSASVLGGKIQMAGGITVPFLKELMQAEGENLDTIWQTLEKGIYVSKSLKGSISGHYESAFEDTESFNVIGKVEGSDPKLKNEFVIHSAHLDHLGVGKPVNGDSIYNGAHDNASGVACALEIARAYTKLATKPKRSVVFAMMTAEELGLLGSGYFNALPTLPKQQIVADINTDMPTIMAPLESVAPLGAEHSSLQKVVEEAAGYVGLNVEPDPDPSEGRFVRSDQYNFVKAGIPALHIKYGYKKTTIEKNLAEKVKVWREANYHKPSDEVNDTFVWSAGRKYAQVNFLISYLVAQNPARPAWNKGDFFETTAGK